MLGPGAQPCLVGLLHQNLIVVSNECRMGDSHVPGPVGRTTRAILVVVRPVVEIRPGAGLDIHTNHLLSGNPRLL